MRVSVAVCCLIAFVLALPATAAITIKDRTINQR